VNRFFKWFGSGFICLPAALLILAASPSSAQESAAVATQTPQLTGIAHAAIRVADLLKSRDFYQKLGFEEAFSMSKDGKPTQSFLKINDRQFIELYPRRDESQPPAFLHVCFESKEIETLNRVYAERGLSPISVRKAAAGNLLFTMVGPEKQNLEYTQYMPGSKHTLDQGKHLGANRISEELVAVGIEMQDAAAAREFYERNLSFVPVPRLKTSEIWFELPGLPSQQVQIVQHAPGTAFQMYFSVPDLRRAAKQLKALHLTVEKHQNTLAIQDPDGNRIVFVKGKPA
jgi:catechol 2,3-dioxygenase-like lactoylglutathione lyase family enzyme